MQSLHFFESVTLKWDDNVHFVKKPREFINNSSELYSTSTVVI